MRFPALLATLALAGACATPATTGKPAAAGSLVAQAGPAGKSAADSDTKWVCEKVRPVGSMLPEEQCREVKRTVQEKRAAQDAMMRAGQVTGRGGN